MKQETLEKAKRLQHAIEGYDGILSSRKAQYGYMLINISCANSNMYDDYFGRIDKEDWDKMLNVLAEERATAIRRLAALSDDSEDGAEADIPSETTQQEEATCMSKSADDSNKPTQARLTWCIIGLYAWMLFCIAYGIMGFGHWLTTVSNTLFTAFLIYLVSTERSRLKVKKED